MKASEVLRRYATGERDFRRINLRGQSFKGQDLSGADFSEADIRGTTFTNAILTSTTFTSAKAGLQRRWLMAQQIMAFVISVLSGALSVVLGVIIAALVFNSGSNQHAYWIAGTVALGFIVATFIAIVRQGFTFKAFLTIAGAVTGVGAVAGAAAVVGDVTTAGIVAGAVVVAVVGAGAIPISVAISVAVANAVSVTVVFLVAIAIAVIVAINVTTAVTFSIALAIVTILVSGYVAWCALKGDEKFALVRTIGVAFGAIGGTSFRGANLTHANFSKAILKSTNFTHTWEKDLRRKRQERETILEWVCWHDAQKLDRARLGNSILSNPAVCELLVTRNGYKKSYVDANLRGADLNGVNLNEANLKWADLSEATLHYADLRGANLSETLVLGTDFKEASLTGTCLEGWNIDHSTNLEGVDCQYVYLLRNKQERRPSSGDFAPGEFTKLFQEVLSTVDLIFRNGVDWRAFVAAFQQVQVENEDTPLEIQSIENKGDGVVVVRVSVPTDTNKEKIHSEFNQQYELALKALEARYQAELQAKDSEISRYREDSANMWEVIKLQAKKPIHVQAIAEAKTMNNSNDSSQTVNIGGNVTGSTINLGAISGAVTNTINQLPETPNPDQPDLKQLLIQLKEAIEADPDLPDTDKADLLEQVQNLAEAKQTEEPAQKEGLARRAKKMFEATLKSLPDTAKIVEASSKLLPLILKALGFSV